MRQRRHDEALVSGFSSLTKVCRKRRRTDECTAAAEGSGASEELG